MSTKEKLLMRFKSKPTDFTWGELNSLLKHLGYNSVTAGKTGGSRSKFIKQGYPPILLHKPHPSPVLKRYQIEYVFGALQVEGLLK